MSLSLLDILTLCQFCMQESGNSVSVYYTPVVILVHIIMYCDHDIFGWWYNTTRDIPDICMTGIFSTPTDAKFEPSEEFELTADSL